MLEDDEYSDEEDGISLLEICWLFLLFNCLISLAAISLQPLIKEAFKCNWTLFTEKDQVSAEEMETNGIADSDGEDIAVPLKRRRKILLIDEDDED